MTTLPRLPDNPIFVPLDTPDIERALDWTRMVKAHVGGIKVGLELFCAHGPDGIARLAAEGLPIFLDVKYHDIPNTVAGAVRAVAGLGIAIVNVHAAGGRAMMEAALEAADQASSGTRPLVIAVTILTSLDNDDLADTGQIGPARDQAVRLAELTRAAGLDGVVCSPEEIGPIREACGPDFKLVVPGIRPEWAAANDQKRITTPAEARARGADVLVIGRPITASDDPARAAARVAAEIGIPGA